MISAVGVSQDIGFAFLGWALDVDAGFSSRYAEQKSIARQGR